MLASPSSGSSAQSGTEGGGARPVLEVVADLRRQVDRLQGRPAAEPVPVHPGLQGLLDVRAGGVYGVDSASLALLLMAGPSARGAWCGIVGVRDLGVEAAVAMGVDPTRTIVVPDPGDRLLEVTAALADVLALVVVRPQRPVSSGDASRLAARLRTRGSVLVPWGSWPGCDARLSLSDVRWAGLEQGAGHLQARRATVSVRRGDAPGRTRSLWLPAPDLTVRAVVQTGEDAVDDVPAPVRSA
ncbi:hypothetical protein ACHAAC_15730 [Aeromicrobium sp. CF4.19]|uniref:hypothetical protein n=1 Tax=Aeromicrobium sp. CF4.19 TaxID=3373082 RepID=UPI003EE64586